LISRAKFPVLLVAVLCSMSAIISRGDCQETATQSPNIVLINLDDADHRMFSPELLELYPSIQSLAQSGIRFTNVHVTTPFCGPSRASLFRGQYAHRTGVRVNIPESPLSLGFKGGYSEFLRQQHHNDELGVWMKRAGYRTMMVGKYHHNGFDFKIPPGWDDFYMSNGGRYQGTYRFINENNSAGEHTRNDLAAYRTDQETDDAVRLIGQHSKRPFFLYLAPLAPHRPVGPDFSLMVDKKKYGEWNSDLRIPRTPDFDEPQLSDKPLHRRSPPYTQKEIEVLDTEYVCRAQAVKSVDDMVGRVVDALKKANVYESTYIFFTSDNGCLLGQHRLHNKLDPYEMSTKVPLLVTGPGIKRDNANHLLAHIDLTATILEIGKAPIPEFVDGKSFASLLTNAKSVDAASWREPIVIENWQTKRNRGKAIPCLYSGLRFYDQLYVEWATGDKEFYDLNEDPFELENQFDKLNDQEKKTLSHQLIASRRVKMDPLLTIIPRDVETWRAPDSAAVLGFAEDDSRVKAVRLEIKHSNGKRYWNGYSWGELPVSLKANVRSSDQQMINWNYPTENIIDATAVDVVAWAIDDEGNRSERFELTIELPSK
jgi:arylsulfatase A-like enzyme